MVTLELKVSGMSCNHCKMSVEKALKELGVKEVKVDLGEGKVIVTFNDALISKEAIINAVEEAGYLVL
ncbi:heavy-metal-associated domain-containing protein [Anaerobranca gottschalkii]|uniref:Copper chaperone CopZ n=1 Tax=Anaerobranca gottschalkii DSM 13577 TaxID=1120990 RepID=A0A1H9YUU6_9FIRM|nr:copper ion binding protein [Anaerobranca gottschalkii]SES72879.1 copper chaperone [Anaerobranca gottschalkii DSM 13577]